MRPLFVLMACLLFSPGARAAEPFLREDWVLSVEPTHLDYWGVNRWGATNFLLPYRALQRAKRMAESAYADNWRFGGETGGAAGVALRGVSVFVDLALFLGPQNIDHVLGHDARARELARDFPGSHRHVARRFTQILPVYFGGRELDARGQGEKETAGRGGADLNTLGNSALWEMDNQFVYEAAKDILAAGQANAAQLENLIFHRLLRLQTSWAPVSQVCAPYHGTQAGTTPPECLNDSGSAPDYSNYLMDLNTGRYGVADVDDYRLKIADLQDSTLLQLLDPVFLLAVYRFGADHLARGGNRSSLPMLPIPGTGVSYLPGLRVDISPFGIEYIQDNYFRYKKTLVNLFWTTGDNRYERRIGLGFDVEGIPLWRGATAGAYGQLYKQPLVSRIYDLGPLSPAEVGRLHNVYNVGVSLRAPLLEFGPPADPKQFLLTLKLGRKNTGWIPGEYIKGSTYAETGLGLRL